MLKVRKTGVTASLNPAILTLYIIMPIFIIWLATWFKVEVNGVHIHHFLLGLALIPWAILELFINQITLRGKAANYKITLIYTTFPLMTFTLATILITTDLKDFLAWVRTGQLTLSVENLLTSKTLI